MFVKWDVDLCRGVDLSREICLLKTKGKSGNLLNMIRSLYAEGSMSLDSKPHHNKMFNYYSHQEDNICRRPRDTTPIEILSQLYEFTFLQEPLQPCNIDWHNEADSNCIIMISNIPASVTKSVLLTCHEINQNQSITDLWLEGLHCDKSHTVPADVFNLSKTVQSITMVNNTLPLDLLEHLIGQLLQGEQLTKLCIDNIRVYNPSTKETDQKQGQVQEFKSKLTWESKSRLQSNPLHSFGTHIVSLFREWEENLFLKQLTLTNCCVSGDTYSYLYNCKMLTHLNLCDNKIGEYGEHIAKIIEKSPLQTLYLRDCSIPSELCEKILKCLCQCKHLTHLDLGGHDLTNQGKHLAKIFQNTESDPPMQGLYLPDCSMPEAVCAKVLKYLPLCRHLTILDLNRNYVGKAGIHIAKTIENMASNSPLESLYLRDCSIPSEICGIILKCLCQCKHLKHLDLGGHDLANQGKHLVKIFKNTGSDPPLQGLYLPDCSISEVECTEVLKYLPLCRHLKILDLNRNNVGKAGIHIAQTIEKMGFDPPLESLYLRDCSIPSDICGKILKCLCQCKQLKHSDLGGHDLANQGKRLAEIFMNIGVDSKIQGIYFPDCSMSEIECAEALEYLPLCRHLTILDLNRNNVGKAGIHILKTIEDMGLDSPLESLYLRNCSIPSDICGEILKCLSQCKHLKHLDLGGHDLVNQGKYLAEIFKNTGADAALQALYLPNCLIPEVDFAAVLEYLPLCTHLRHLNLDGNKMGKAGKHIVKTIENMGFDPPLESLYLRDCSIPRGICREILKCLSKCKRLKDMNLGGHE